MRLSLRAPCALNDGKQHDVVLQTKPVFVSRNHVLPNGTHDRRPELRRAIFGRVLREVSVIQLQRDPDGSVLLRCFQMEGARPQDGPQVT